MEGTVVIDCFPGSAQRYRDRYAIIVIDVIRATTTATTAVSLRRRVFPVQTTDEAFVLASTLEDPILVGELGGNMKFEPDTEIGQISADFEKCRFAKVSLGKCGMGRVRSKWAIP